MGSSAFLKSYSKIVYPRIFYYMNYDRKIRPIKTCRKHRAAYKS
jgi:hypothetical protein